MPRFWEGYWESLQYETDIDYDTFTSLPIDSYWWYLHTLKEDGCRAIRQYDDFSNTEWCRGLGSSKCLALSMLLARESKILPPIGLAMPGILWLQIAARRPFDADFLIFLAQFTLLDCIVKLHVCLYHSTIT